MSSGLAKLFTGVANVVRNDKTTVPVSQLCSQNKYLLLYFSAHWCPPCRAFTPVLVEFYKALRTKRQDVDLVFFSSDKSEKEFDEYFATMPWLALPYSERTLKAKLSGKFKVEGIPTLLCIDADGNIACKDAAEHVASGEGNQFEDAIASLPWAPPTLTEILSEAKIIAKDGSVISIDTLRGMDSFAFYFSAHWCGPCRSFTPMLIKTYAALKASKPNTEIIFVSSDRDQKSFDDYYGTMPWAAMEFGSSKRGALSALCEVQGIPTLVTVDAKSLTIVNRNARGAAMNDPAGANFPWTPKPLPLVTDLSMEEEKVELLNERCCFLLHLPEDQPLVNFKAVIDAFQASALDVDAFRQQQPDGEDLKVIFFTVDPGEGDELFGKVLTVTKAPVQSLHRVPYILAMRLGPNKVVDILSGNDVESAEKIAAFGKAFYVKAAAV